MELGIASWSLPWSIGVPGYPQPALPLNAIGLLEKAVEADVRLVQIADNLPLHEIPTAELDRLREAAIARGLTLEAGTRGLDPEHLARYVGIAHRMGARVLRTVLSGSQCGPEQLVAAEAGIRQILPALDRSGITLALENNEAFSAAEFAGLIGRIDSPRLGICLDTANSLGRPETLETVVAQLAEYAVVLHAKDYDIQRIDTRMGFCVIGKPAGEGRVDFDRVLAELRRCGRTGISVIVEHWPPFAGTIGQTVQLEEEWLTRSVRFLRSRLSGMVDTVIDEAVGTPTSIQRGDEGGPCA
jgi:sugar phosphate isomerase/epimerase